MSHSDGGEEGNQAAVRSYNSVGLIVLVRTAQVPARKIWASTVEGRKRNV